MTIKQDLGLHRCNLGKVYSNAIMSWSEFYENVLDNTENNYKILDAGAGEGRLKELFHEYKIQYLGVDSAVGDTTWDYSNVVKADLEDLNFIKDNEFDLVIMIQVLEHLKNPAVVLRELNRVLKPGQRIFISAPQGQGIHQVPHDFFRFTPYGFNHLLEDAGFAMETINPQLCGDLESSINKTIWTLQYYIEENSKLTKFILIMLYICMKILNKFTRYFDNKSSRHTDPIGYFVTAKKK
jgi:ubiquinone/menaquinone biosynthesis C-methylase UbiE